MIAGFSFQSRPIAVPLMRAHDLHSRPVTSVPQPKVAAAALPRTRVVAPFSVLVAIALFLATAFGEVVDPLANGPADPDLFGDNAATNSAPPATLAPTTRPRQDAGPVNLPINKQPSAGANTPQPLPAPAGAAEPP